MPRAIARSHLGGEWRFIFIPTPEFVERESHGLDILLANVPHESDKRARVDSAGKKCTDRDSGDGRRADAVEQRLSNDELQLLRICGCSKTFRTTVRVGHREILFGLTRTDPVDPKRRARRQGAYFLVGRKWLRHAAE